MSVLYTPKKIAEIETRLDAIDVEISKSSETITYTGYTSKDATGILLATEETDTSNVLLSLSTSGHTRYTFIAAATFVAEVNTTNSIAGSGCSFYNSSNVLKRSAPEANPSGTSSASLSGQAAVGDYLIFNSVNAQTNNVSTNFSVTATPL